MEQGAGLEAEELGPPPRPGCWTLSTNEAKSPGPVALTFHRVSEQQTSRMHQRGEKESKSGRKVVRAGQRVTFKKRRKPRERAIEGKSISDKGKGLCQCKGPAQSGDKNKVSG